MNSAAGLKQSILWFKQVIAESRDQAQIERCEKAVLKLEKELWDTHRIDAKVAA